MKLINDILTVKGKYSLKRVISVITFIYVINLSVYVAYSIKPNGVGIVASLLAFLAALLGINELGKTIKDKTEE